MDFKSGQQLIGLCETNECPISEIMLIREETFTERTRKDIINQMGKTWQIMKESAHSSVENPKHSIGGLIGGEAKLLSEHLSSGKSICKDPLSRAITYSMSILETSASMGLIVAAPTAGSAGIVPGLLLALQETYDFSDNDIIRVLFNAGAVGCLAMRNATVAGAVGGCQAEVGVASAMAASAAVELIQEELLEAFEKEGISVLPLKGILMKRFYPVTSMRMMADLDILYETGRGKEVEAVLTDLGYYCDHRDSHHDVFFRKPFMNIEMHHCMIGEDSLLDAYYEDIWKRARQEEGKSHIYRLSWEDFYIFMIAHMAKHFQGGGCGIRSIVDMWLFSDRMKESLDWDYVRKELEKIELAQFERCMCDLVSVWFEEKAETEFYAQLTELLMQSGIYGTITNYNIQHVAEVDKRVWKGQIKVWMEAIFLPYKAMKMQYPYLEKYPVFLPAAWIQRIFRTCFCRKGRAGEVLSGMKVEGNEVRKRQDLFGKLGLS